MPMEDNTMTTCSRCQAEVPAGVRFCGRCGSRVPLFRPGQQIEGKYEVIELIAEGGMGEVFKVHHLHLDEVRIVKIMRADLLPEDSQQKRFQYEAKLATRV